MFRRHFVGDFVETLPTRQPIFLSIRKGTNIPSLILATVGQINLSGREWLNCFIPLESKNSFERKFWCYNLNLGSLIPSINKI